MCHSRPIFLYFRLFNSVDIKRMFNVNFWQWLDSNCGSLVLEATTLPTEPQPLPIQIVLFVSTKENIYKNKVRCYLELNCRTCCYCISVAFSGSRRCRKFSRDLSSLSARTKTTSPSSIRTIRRPGGAEAAVAVGEAEGAGLSQPAQVQSKTSSFNTFPGFQSCWFS